MAFLRNLLATIVGLIIFTVISIFFLFIFIGIASSEETPEVKVNSVLYINLSGPLVQRSQEDPFSQLFGDGVSPVGLDQVLKSLNYAKNDNKIKGVYLKHGFLAGGFASMQEIRDALTEFKESGKFVYSYGAYLSEGDYFLASVADSIFVNHEGALEINGLSANVTFFKGLLDKLGIEAQVFKVGDFKSAVEPFMRKDMSEPNREQLESILNSIYSNYADQVAESRGISKDKFMEIADQMLVRLPEDAADLGLITRLAYHDEPKTAIREKLGLEEDKKIEFVTLANYAKYAKPKYDGSFKNRIAVIVADGQIVMGSGSDAVAGDRFAKEIREARENDKVKAIVLRVNSPGGSLTASDIIWREVMLTKGVKPIIASMGDVAASGGYFIAMPCDTIIAQATTITGSIGIFGIIPNFENLLENKLGITSDQVKIGEYSDIATVSRKLNEQERAIIQNGVEAGYDTFISKAAEGRNLPEEDILKVASGRVWTGEQALERGLIDMIGDLDDAIELAARNAGLEEGDYKVKAYPEQKEFLEQLMEDMGANAQARIARSYLGEAAPFAEKIKDLNQIWGIQARIPYDIEFR